MSKSKKYIWFCLYFLLLHFTTINATGVLQRDKVEGGHEGCCRILPATGLPVEIALTINGNVDASTCSFPWKIKAVYKTYDDRPLNRTDDIITESDEINISDFYSIDDNGLIRTIVSLSLFDGTEAPTISICEESSCYDQQLVEKKEIIYKIFSGDEQVNQDCSLFDHPSLETESIELDHKVDICDCQGASVTGKRPRSDIELNTVTKSQSDILENNPYIDFNFAETDFTHLQNPRSTQVTIYPNPVKQQMNIKLHSPFNKPLSVEIISLQGKSLMTKTVAPMSEVISIDSHNLSNGIYVLKVKGLDNKGIIKRFSVFN